MTERLPPYRHAVPGGPWTAARLWLLAPAAGALALCGAYFAGELYTLDGRLGLPLDDSWIHLAFARNLAAGHGLGIDPGELVAGSTGPLWTALVALGARLPVPDLAWMQLLGVGFHLGGVALAGLLARELGLGRALAALAAALTALTGWLAWSALSGMEISLFVFLTLAGMVLHLRERAERRRPPLSLAVLGLGSLARPEGALLVALAAADRFLRFRRGPRGVLSWDRAALAAPAVRRALKGLALAALAVAPVALFNAWIGGSPLPTTLAAKTAGGGQGLHPPDIAYLHLALGVLFQPQPWAAVLAPAGALVLVRRLGSPRDRGLLPALWLFALPLAYSCLTPPGGGALIGNFGRYLFPLFPVAVVLAIVALEPVARALAPGGGRSPLRAALALAALVVLSWPAATACARTAGLYAHNLADIEAGDVRMARWLAPRLPPEAVVATMDIGALSALLPNPIVDLAGIADPEVHGYIRRARAAGADWQEGVLAFAAERRPDYLVVFPEWLSAVERPGAPFRRVLSIHVPGNITLGRDTLVLYSTPWTRFPLRVVPQADEETGGGESS
jgi:arabinofuranosyltransferase